MSEINNEINGEILRTAKLYKIWLTLAIGSNGPWSRNFEIRKYNSERKKLGIFTTKVRFYDVWLFFCSQPAAPPATKAAASHKKKTFFKSILPGISISLIATCPLSIFCRFLCVRFINFRINHFYHIKHIQNYVNPC